MRDGGPRGATPDSATPAGQHDTAGAGCVGIIGLGLIGGSLAHDLAATGTRVLGFDRDARTLDAARAAGAVHASLGEQWERLEEVDTLLIAVSADAAIAVLHAIARIDPACLVMDVGSTKQSIMQAAQATSLRNRFIGAHPLAGDHRSGFAAARPGLFRGATVYLTPAPDTGSDLRTRAERLWERVGARPLIIDPAAHDELLAWTSHLPQALSSALAAALLDAGVQRDQLGPGGTDMTRLAGSDPGLWSAILLDNARNVGDAMEQLARGLDTLRNALDARDGAALRRFIERGRAFRVGTTGAEPAADADPQTHFPARQAGMRISSEAFEEGAEIPTRFTCDGADISPPLTIEDVPHHARTLALIVDDPDAPMGTFVHWLLWNLPAGVRDLPENVPADRSVKALGDARQGVTHFKRVGYGGPCPPDRRHTYRFLLYALDTALELEPGATRAQLDDAMKGHVIAEAILRGTYDRPNR